MELYTPLISFNWTILFMWATVLVLYLIMKRKFFDKVHNFMVNRENSVRDSLDNAAKTNEVAEQKLADYEKRIENFEAEGREIVKAAKVKADANARDIIEEANERANQMIKQAEEEIQRLQARAVSDMKAQLGGLAIMAAEKILEKQLEVSGQEEYIAGVIEEAGKSLWQN